MSKDTSGDNVVPNNTIAMSQLEFILWEEFMKARNMDSERQKLYIEDLLEFSEFRKKSLEAQEKKVQEVEEDAPKEQISPKEQKIIDRLFGYIAPSLFVTSIVATGEVVGSSIWRMSKYVTKDVIGSTLGASAIAAILQSANQVGCAESVKEFFEFEKPKKTAEFAATFGGIAGNIFGGLCTTALSGWLLPLAITVPVLIPYIAVLEVGLALAGVIAGGIIGAAIGAAVNEAFFALIGIPKALYQGGKEIANQFGKRVSHSSKLISLKSEREKNKSIIVGDEQIAPLSDKIEKINILEGVNKSQVIIGNNRSQVQDSNSAKDQSKDEKKQDLESPKTKSQRRNANAEPQEQEVKGSHTGRLVENRQQPIDPDNPEKFKIANSQALKGKKSYTENIKSALINVEQNQRWQAVTTNKRKENNNFNSGPSIKTN